VARSVNETQSQLVLFNDEYRLLSLTPLLRWKDIVFGINTTTQKLLSLLSLRNLTATASKTIFYPLALQMVQQVQHSLTDAGDYHSDAPSEDVKIALADLTQKTDTRVAWRQDLDYACKDVYETRLGYHI